MWRYRYIGPSSSLAPKRGAPWSFDIFDILGASRSPWSWGHIGAMLGWCGFYVGPSGSLSHLHRQGLLLQALLGKGNPHELTSWPCTTRTQLSNIHFMDLYTHIYIHIYHIISIILYYLYYIILYCIVLYYIILYYIILYYSVFYYIILYYIKLYYIILYHIILYHIILYHINLFCIILCVYIIYIYILCIHLFIYLFTVYYIFSYKTLLRHTPPSDMRST